MAYNIEDKIKEQQDRYFKTIRKILQRNVHHFSELIEATPKQDMEEGFDAVFRFNHIKVPIRIRGFYYAKKYGDITIRCRSQYDNDTEYHKIKKGFGDYYFYCWLTEDESKIHSYLIFNINKFRQSGLINQHGEMHKNKGSYLTSFYSYSVESLKKNDCLVIYECLYPEFTHNVTSDAILFK